MEENYNILSIQEVLQKVEDYNDTTYNEDIDIYNNNYIMEY